MNGDKFLDLQFHRVWAADLRKHFDRSYLRVAANDRLSADSPRTRGLSADRTETIGGPKAPYSPPAAISSMGLSILEFLAEPRTIRGPTRGRSPIQVIDHTPGTLAKDIAVLVEKSATGAGSRTLPDQRPPSDRQLPLRSFRSMEGASPPPHSQDLIHRDCSRSKVEGQRQAGRSQPTLQTFAAGKHVRWRLVST